MQTGAGHLFILHSFSSLCPPQWSPFFLCLSHLYSSRSLDCSQIRFASADRKTRLYHTISCPRCHSRLFSSLSSASSFTFNPSCYLWKWQKKPSNFWKHSSMWWFYTRDTRETSSLTTWKTISVIYQVSLRIKIPNCPIRGCKVLLHSWGITSADVSHSGSLTRKQESWPHLFRNHFTCIPYLPVAFMRLQLENFGCESQSGRANSKEQCWRAASNVMSKPGRFIIQRRRRGNADNNNKGWGKDLPLP